MDLQGMDELEERCLELAIAYYARNVSRDVPSHLHHMFKDPEGKPERRVSKMGMGQITDYDEFLQKCVQG